MWILFKMWILAVNFQENVNLGTMCHETKDRKNDKSSENRGCAIAKSNDKCVSMTIVVEFVVAGECDYASKCWTKGVKDLCCCCTPHLKSNSVVKTSVNYVSVRIYKRIRIIKQSEMRPHGGATFWDNHLPAVTTIFTPFLVCLKPKILPKKQPTFEKKKK